MTIDRSKIENLKHYCYKITNLINDKCYIGITYKNIESRFKEHIKVSKLQDKTKLQSLHNAINKYGVENFKIEKISIHKNLKTAFEAEVKNIKKYNSKINGYNETNGGDGAIKIKFSFSKEEIEKILILFIKGNSNKKISEIMNRKIGSIRDVLRFRFSKLHKVSRKLIKQAQNIKNNSNRKNRINQTIILNIFNDYAFNNLTMEQIGNKYNYNVSTIYGMLARTTHKKYLIPEDLLDIVNNKRKLSDKLK